MKKLSIVGRDYHTNKQVIGYYNASDRMKYLGKLGVFWVGRHPYPNQAGNIGTPPVTESTLTIELLRRQDDTIDKS